MSKASKIEQKVGYKNPPKEYQWSKGESGNPFGRRKKRITDMPIDEAAGLFLAEEVELELQGKKTKMSKAQALALRLINAALSAPPRVALPVLRQIEGFGWLKAHARLVWDRKEEEEREISEAERIFLAKAMADAERYMDEDLCDRCLTETKAKLA